jgi:hypothetical protein
MVNDQTALPKLPDHRLDAAIASIWVVFLAFIAVTEIVVSLIRSLFA